MTHEIRFVKDFLKPWQLKKAVNGFHSGSSFFVYIRRSPFGTETSNTLLQSPRGFP